MTAAMNIREGYMKQFEHHKKTCASCRTPDTCKIGKKLSAEIRRLYDIVERQTRIKLTKKHV